MTVSYIKAYFNSMPSWQEDHCRCCTDPSADKVTCIIPVQMAALDALSSGDNTTIGTFFFNQQQNMTVNRTDFSEPQMSHASPKSRARMVDTIVAMLLGYALVKCLSNVI